MRNWVKGGIIFVVGGIAQRILDKVLDWSEPILPTIFSDIRLSDILLIIGLITGSILIVYGVWKSKPISKQNSAVTQPSFNEPLLGEYSSNDFLETRPILLEKPNMSEGEKEKARKAYREARSKYEIGLVEKYKTEELVAWIGQRFPVSVLINCNLQENQVDGKFDRDRKGNVKKYELPQAIYEWGYEQLLAFQKKNPLVKPIRYDGSLARLVNYEYTEERLRLLFTESSFYQCAVTDLAMDVRSKSRQITLREILEPATNAKLLPISEYPSAGSLGAGCIVKSKDNKFVVTWRSAQVSNAKLRYAPSAGGVTRSDDTMPDGSPSVFQAAKRHLRQEMAVGSNHIKRIIFLGITRELERAGQNDGHFYVEVDLSYRELDELREKAEHRKEIVRYIPVVPCKIADYIFNEDSSPTLRGEIYLLQKEMPEECK